MDTGKKPQFVEDDVVVSIDYELTVDGEVVDSSEGEEPLEYLQGHKNIIPGLERQLAGMRVGETRQVLVPAADAYGPLDPDAMVEIPRAEFPEDIPLEMDLQLEVSDSEGEVRDARIVKIEENTITLDFNHPLAGQDLNFKVTVVDLRQPTAEELEHGHVHGEGHDHDWEEEELEEDEE